MLIAERNGDDLRRRLRSAERLSERAICSGFLVKTRFSKSSALLRSVTAADQRRGERLFDFVALARDRRDALLPVFRDD